MNIDQRLDKIASDLERQLHRQIALTESAKRLLRETLLQLRQSQEREGK
jgi:plasmid maintenance system killer protein